MTTRAKINKKNLKFQVRFILEKDDPGYHAYAPSLPGLHMPGDTREEALKNAREAAALFLKSMIEDGDPIPIDVITPSGAAAGIDSPENSCSVIEEIQVNLA
jgi:predicted RNase H-like HicB family nuclease